MLLDMIASVPDCRRDILRWRPKSYREHFAASGFSGRDLAIAAYEAADPAVRARIDSLADCMHDLVATAIAFVAADPSSKAAGEIAEHIAAQLRPLVVTAGAVINGADESEADVSAQAAIDDLLKA